MQSARLLKSIHESMPMLTMSFKYDGRGKCQVMMDLHHKEEVVKVGIPEQEDVADIYRMAQLVQNFLKFKK